MLCNQFAISNGNYNFYWFVVDAFPFSWISISSVGGFLLLLPSAGRRRITLPAIVGLVGGASVLDSSRARRKWTQSIQISKNEIYIYLWMTWTVEYHRRKCSTRWQSGHNSDWIRCQRNVICHQKEKCVASLLLSLPTNRLKCNPQSSSAAAAMTVDIAIKCDNTILISRISRERRCIIIISMLPLNSVVAIYDHALSY